MGEGEADEVGDVLLGGGLGGVGCGEAEGEHVFWGGMVS